MCHKFSPCVVIAHSIKNCGSFNDYIFHFNNKAVWAKIRPVGTVGWNNNSHECSGFSTGLDKVSNYLSSAGESQQLISLSISQLHLRRSSICVCFRVLHIYRVLIQNGCVW